MLEELEKCRKRKEVEKAVKKNGKKKESKGKVGKSLNRKPHYEVKILEEA